jgi:Zn2+/Cd2+-exporting ATPase
VQLRSETFVISGGTFMKCNDQDDRLTPLDADPASGAMKTALIFLPPLPRAIAVLFLVLASLGLVVAFGTDFYVWPDPLYVGLNGLIMLIGAPAILARAGREMFGEGRLGADLLLSAVIVSAATLGLLLEGALVVLLGTLSECLERAAKNRLKNEARSLSVADTDTVRRRTETGTEEVLLREIEIGQVVLVQEDETVPVDGDIVFGTAQLSEAAITGESGFSPKGQGQSVFAGSRVEHGFIEVRMTQRGDQTLLAQMEQAVARAAGKSTWTENMIDRATGVLVPLLFAIGLGVFLFHYLTSPDRSLEGIRAAARIVMTMLVVASPAALALAAPTAVWAAMRRAARQGILFRDGNVMERLARVRTLLLDKTGTLTHSRPTVVDVQGFEGVSAGQVLAEAVFVERHSGHPLAKTIVAYAAERVQQVEEPDRFIEFEGGGACAIKGDRHIKVGAMWLMEDGRDISEETLEWFERSRDQGRTCVLIADKTRIIGGIAFEDAMRPEAKTVLQQLRKLGVRKMVMLTGDSAKAAHAIAVSLGMNEYVAECMPDTKMHRVVKEQSYGSSGVAMVGDGINDAPALLKADVGISMGAKGTDLAIAASHVTLLNDQLDGLVAAFRMSRRLVTVMGANVVIACVFGLLLMILAAGGYLDLLPAVLLQQVVGLLLLANARLWA